jgi:hypothetical protein
VNTWVFSIEGEEWLQYTVTVPKAGKYNVSFNVSSASDTGSISLLELDQPLIKEVSVPNTGGEKNWQFTTPQYLFLKKGTLVFRVRAEKGGFTLNSIRFTRK